MAIELLGSDVEIFRDPIVEGSHLHRWWADRGRVHWEDQVTGSYGSQTVRETLERLQALSEMIYNSRTRDKAFKPDEINAYQTHIEKMTAICKKAREQGMADNPEHSKQLVSDFKAKRHSRLVMIPNSNSKMKV